MVPGGFSAKATEVEQEGLRLPPVKLFKRGEMDRRDLRHHQLQHPHRRPAHRRHQGPGGGAEGRRAAADRADRPLRQGHGGGGHRRDPRARAAQPDAGAHRRPSPTASTARRRSSIPTASSTSRCKIALAVTKAGETLHFDFTGSSPPCRGPMNSVRGDHLFGRLPRHAPHLPRHAAQRRRVRAAASSSGPRAPSSTRAIRAPSRAAPRRCRSASPRPCSWRWCRPSPTR